MLEVETSELKALFEEAGEIFKEINGG